MFQTTPRRRRNIAICDDDDVQHKSIYMYITWKASLFEEDKRDDPPKTNKQTNKQTNDDDDDDG